MWLLTHFILSKDVRMLNEKQPFYTQGIARTVLAVGTLRNANRPFNLGEGIN